MTRAANELTSGASAGAGATGGPYLLASVVRGMFEMAVAIGLDRATLLTRLEVDEATLADTNARVPLEALYRVWEALGELPNAASLAILICDRMNFDHFGVVGWAMLNSAVAGDLIRISRRFQAVFGDPIVPEIDESPDGMIIHKVFEPRIARTRIGPEFAPAHSVWMMRELTGATRDDELVREVWFQHEAPPDPSLHERYFNAPIRWSAPETRLALTRAGVDRPILRRNAELYAYLENHVRALATAMSGAPSTAARVREFVLEALKGNEPTPAGAAKKLGMSERTLQRRLKEEGRTFADVLDDVRRALAVRYLGDPSLAIFEIAFLLGYAETSSFHRAFKRWTNEGPAEFRAKATSARRGATSP